MKTVVIEEEQNDSKNWKIFTLSIGDESRKEYIL